MTVVLAAPGGLGVRRGETVERIRAEVAKRLGDVRVGWVARHQPTLAATLAGAPRPVVVVTLELIPAGTASAGLSPGVGFGSVVTAPALAPDLRVLEALDDRTADALAGSARTVVPDGLVLAADDPEGPDGDAFVREVAASWGERNRLPVTVAYPSGRPDLAAAVEELRDTGARGVAVGAFFLGPVPGYTAIREAAYDLGIEVVAAPLGAHREVIHLIVERAQHTVWPVPR